MFITRKAYICYCDRCDVSESLNDYDYDIHSRKDAEKYLREIDWRFKDGFWLCPQCSINTECKKDIKL